MCSDTLSKVLYKVKITGKLQPVKLLYWQILFFS